MGSTTLHRERGQTDRDFFEREVRPHGRIVACATIRNVFYAAVQNSADAPYRPGETWALVVLFSRNSRSHWNFTYKVMTEGDGPIAYAAPAAVLDALSPTTDADAVEWRARCRKRIDDKRAVTRGVEVTFVRPMRFSDGVERSVLRFVAGSTFEGPDGVLVRIPDWLDREYTIGALAAA